MCCRTGFVFLRSEVRCGSISVAVVVAVVFVVEVAASLKKPAQMIFISFFICAAAAATCIENSKHAKCAAKAEKINSENVNYTISEQLLSGRSTAT